MANSKGDIFRPTEGFRTEMVKTKPGENQLPGDVLVWDSTNKYYKIAATNATGVNSAVVVNTDTNVNHGAANINIDGKREALVRDWEVAVTCTSGCNVGDELKYSATVAGTVDKYVIGSDTDGNKIVGRCVKLASEEHYGVDKVLTDPPANSLIIMYKYPSRPSVDTS